METVKKVLKQILPDHALNWYRRVKLNALRKANLNLNTREIFSAIYAENMWGGEAGTYCSGSGSQLTVGLPYCEMVRKFVAEKSIRSILDIGCGDFTIGQQIQMPGVHYIGVDIVPELVERNMVEFGSESIEFRCLNAIEDPLPNADLVLVRQVFQHLSNDQICQVLGKLSCYSYVMVTEHFPAPGDGFVPNLDKPHGSDTRIPDNSAVCLDKPPFYVDDVRLILEVPAVSCLVREGETIRTMLFSAPDVAENAREGFRDSR